jgi:hypothetical protein
VTENKTTLQCGVICASATAAFRRRCAIIHSRFPRMHWNSTEAGRVFLVPIGPRCTKCFLRNEPCSVRGLAIEPRAPQNCTRT